MALAVAALAVAATKVAHVAAVVEIIRAVIKTQEEKLTPAAIKLHPEIKIIKLHPEIKIKIIKILAAEPRKKLLEKELKRLQKNEEKQA